MMACAEPIAMEATRSAPLSGVCVTALTWAGSIAPVKCRTKPRRSTPMIGKSDARVTIPNPPIPESCFLASTRAIPIPRARTRGTVTGPVVMAPESQARPMISRTPGVTAAMIVRTVVNPTTGKR